MEGEDLQLDRQIDLAYVDLLGDDEHERGEVEDAAHSCSHQPVAHLLGPRRRGGDHADRWPEPANQPLELRHVADGETSNDLVDASRVGVEQGGDVEAARREPAVVGERVAKVADADDDDRPVLGEAELAGDLVHEVVDVVADAAGAVRTEVGQVLAQLRRADAGSGRQILRGDGGDAVVLQSGQRPQVDGQPRHRGLGDAPRPRGGTRCWLCGHGCLTTLPDIRPGLGRG